MTHISYRIKKTLDGKLHKELLIKEGKQMTKIERKMSQVMYREEPMTDVNPSKSVKIMHAQGLE